MQAKLNYHLMTREVGGFSKLMSLTGCTAVFRVCQPVWLHICIQQKYLSAKACPAPWVSGKAMGRAGPAQVAAHPLSDWALHNLNKIVNESKVFVSPEYNF